MSRIIWLGLLRLFGRVGRETTTLLGYPYPIEAEQQVMAMIEAMLNGIEPSPTIHANHAPLERQGHRRGTIRDA